MSHSASRLRDLEVSVLPTATAHHPTTRDWLRTVPASGASLRRVLLDASHDSHRCPPVQDVVSSGRLVTCAQDSAGTRYGTGGPKIGHASLKGAVSEAAVLCWRDQPSGQHDRARLANKPGTGKALTVLAHHWARTVSARLTRATAFHLDQFSHG
jgi:hypothetical protein